MHVHCTFNIQLLIGIGNCELKIEIRKCLHYVQEVWSNGVMEYGIYELRYEYIVAHTSRFQCIWIRFSSILYFIQNFEMIRKTHTHTQTNHTFVYCLLSGTDSLISNVMYFSALLLRVEIWIQNALINIASLIHIMITVYILFYNPLA